jgi:hydrogenase maturation factor
MRLDADRCTTCGDVAVVGIVVEVRDEAAVVDVDGRPEEVDVSLVMPVAPGDPLLCHAGIALQRVTA